MSKPNTSYFEAPPNSENIVLPDGYVFGPAREYPIAPRTSERIIDIFDEYSSGFIKPFQPGTVVASIKAVKAARASNLLVSRGYSKIHGAFIGSEDNTRTVAEVLDLDFGIASKRIVEYIKQGAIVGPSFTEDKKGRITRVINRQKPFRPVGVGLWIRDQST